VIPEKLRFWDEGRESGDEVLWLSVSMLAGEIDLVFVSVGYDVFENFHAAVAASILMTVLLLVLSVRDDLSDPNTTCAI
jgi:hypothetical protein